MGRWGQLEEAERYFHRALRRDPDDALALREYAWALIQSDLPEQGPLPNCPADAVCAANVAKAVRLAERAVALDPHNGSGHYYLALALCLSRGGRDRAIEHLRLALKVRSDFRQASELLREISM